MPSPGRSGAPTRSAISSSSATSSTDHPVPTLATEFRWGAVSSGADRRSTSGSPSRSSSTSAGSRTGQTAAMAAATAASPSKARRTPTGSTSGADPPMSPSRARAASTPARMPSKPRSVSSINCCPDSTIRRASRSSRVVRNTDRARCRPETSRRASLSSPATSSAPITRTSLPQWISSSAAAGSRSRTARASTSAQSTSPLTEAAAGSSFLVTTTPGSSVSGVADRALRSPSEGSTWSM